MASTSGCEERVIGADTPGTTYVHRDERRRHVVALGIREARRDGADGDDLSPQPTIYDVGEVVQPAFTCSDAVSGVAMCTSDPVDTSAPGYRTFLVSMTDRAGNPGVSMVDYAVASGVCAPGLPDNVGWWRMEGRRSTRGATARAPRRASG